MNMYRIIAAALAVSAIASACSKNPEREKTEAVARGDQYVTAQQYNEAIVEYRRAVQIDPRFGEAREKLGQTYLKTGEIPGALRETVRAADLLPNRADLQLRAGNLLLAVGSFEDARTRADRVLAGSPQNVEALVLRGNALAGLKDLDGALGEFEKAAAADPKRGLVLTNIGAVQMAKGATADAERAFKTATEVSPNSALARVSYANFLLSTKQTDRAEQELKDALAASPLDSTVRRALIVLYLSTSRPADAEPHLRALAEDSQDPQARFALARFYLATEAIDEALREFRVLAAKKDSYVDATLEIAAAQYRTGQTAEAHQSLNEVLTQFPSHARAKLLQAEFLIEEAKWAGAIDAAKSAVDHDPKLVEGHFALGLALQGKGDLEGAKQAFTEVLRQQPNAARAQLALAELHLVNRDAAAAQQLATQAAAHAPQSLEAKTTLINAMLANKDLTGASGAIREFKTAFPGNENGYVLEGSLQLLRKEFTAADKSFAKAEQMNTGSLPAARGRVQAMLAAGRTAEARTYVQRLIASHADKAEFLILAGRTYATAGDYAAAEPVLRNALELEPSRSETYGLLAQLYLLQGHPDQALTEYQNLAAREPKSVSARTMLGTINQMTNRRPQAKDAYRQALALDPSAAVAANNLAWMLAEDNEDLDRALELAQTAKSKLPDSANAADTLKFVYLKKGLTDSAIGEFTQAIEKEPNAAGFRYRLGFAYSKQGELTQARQTLEKALAMDAKAPEAAEAKATLARLAKLGS